MKKPVGVIIILFLFAIIFWACYEQAGSSFNLFARDFTDRNVFGREFPAGWYQAVPATAVVLLAPVFAWLWLKWGAPDRYVIISAFSPPPAPAVLREHTYIPRIHLQNAA